MTLNRNRIDPASGVFRSEEMVLCQLFFQSNVAFETTCRLGELGIAEFRDLNGDLNSYQRKYVDEIRRINEIQRNLVYLHEQLLKKRIDIKQPEKDPSIPRYKEIIQIENRIEDIDRELKNVNQQLHSLRLQEMELVEMNEIFLRTDRSIKMTRRNRQQSLYGTINGTAVSKIIDDNILLNDLSNNINKNPSSMAFENDKLHTVTGLIRADKADSFHKLIWRVCNQNALVQFNDIDMPINDVKNDELVKKKVFLILCQGDQLLGKIKKICDAFRTSQYQLPDDEETYQHLSKEVGSNLIDTRLVIEKTLKQKYKVLMTLAQAENFQTWCNQITKLFAIFNTMNLFCKTEKGFLAECWCAQSDYNQLKMVIEDITKQTGVQGQALVEIVSTPQTPPTFFRLNKFTEGFQGIVSSYGIASYREINPAPYTVISFPFLFAVMFADAGHGLIMALFALWMVLFEKKLQGKSQNEIWLTFFDGRYIILLMGIFSMYTGFIYNDVFAKSYNLFGTAFSTEKVENLIHNVTTPSSLFSDDSNESFNENITSPLTSSMFLEKSSRNYPFGVDPVWQLSENKIIFLNSFKMKLSVILGVGQMFFGVMLSLVNHINFNDNISMLFEFIPQIIFLLALFGYMIVLIFVKWLTIFPAYLAPSILIDFINMFLYKYPDEASVTHTTKYLLPWYPNKKLIQTVLLLGALLCVPIMLLVKPTILVFFSKSEPPSNDVESGQETGKNQTKLKSGEHQGDGGHESAGDIFIHQAIHTIEYCLGSISHTASYLRLWALSLAHSQLSEVLWSMVMRKGFASSSSSVIVRILVTYVTFAFWAVLTVAILIVMEGLSAFLHAIRLHWVEFQSKFYKGTGYQFKPFHLKRFVAEENFLKVSN